jgi:hypothetical protein
VVNEVLGELPAAGFQFPGNRNTVTGCGVTLDTSQETLNAIPKFSPQRDIAQNML